MRKVISFELKKLVSRIGIYILVLLMAGLLIAGVFMYDPIERPITTKNLVGETVSEMYANFTNDLQSGYMNTVEAIALNASTYVATSPTYNQYNNSKHIHDLFTSFDDYCRQYNETTATNDEYAILQQGILQSLENLRMALDDTLEFSKNKTGYYILTTKDNYTKLFTVISDINKNFTSSISHQLAGEKYFNEYRESLHACLQNLTYPNLTKTAKKYAPNGTYYSLITFRMEEIAIQMQKEYNNVVTDPLLEKDAEIKAELNTLFNRYVNCVNIFEQAYNSSMFVDAISNIKGALNKASLIGYGDISLYEQKENAVEYEYYITHHSNPNDYANSLSVTHTSNKEMNAYDFSFFVMSIYGIIIIIFAIYLSANTISGEINNNTMRFTAIRPVKRGTIFFGKYIAIIIMSLILLLFGTIASFVTGGILYGFESANILMIINSSFVVIAHPMAVLGLFIASLLLLTAFYSAITIMLSCLIKSDALAMIIGLIFYIINLILPLFFNAGSWLRFYPFTNINLFAYFGSNRLTTDSILSKLFNNIVYHGMNIWISLIYIIGITVILLLIGKTLFKRKEL